MVASLPSYMNHYDATSLLPLTEKTVFKVYTCNKWCSFLVLIQNLGIDTPLYNKYRLCARISVAITIHLHLVLNVDFIGSQKNPCMGDRNCMVKYQHINTQTCRAKSVMHCCQNICIFAHYIRKYSNHVYKCIIYARTTRIYSFVEKNGFGVSKKIIHLWTTCNQYRL